MFHFHKEKREKKDKNKAGRWPLTHLNLIKEGGVLDNGRDATLWLSSFCLQLCAKKH